MLKRKRNKVELEYSFCGDYSLKQESAIDEDKMEISLQFFTGVEDGK